MHHTGSVSSLVGKISFRPFKETHFCLFLPGFYLFVSLLLSTALYYSSAYCYLIAHIVGMVIMAVSSTVPMLLVGEIIAQVGVDTVLAVTTALIPDQIPLAQRPFISSCVGMAPNVGGVIGLLLVSHFTDTRVISQGYLLMAAVSLFCVMFFL